MDFGAAGDGITDDLQAFTDALAAAKNMSGNKVFVPVGKYLISGVLGIPDNTVLEGFFVGPISSSDGNIPGGTVIYSTWGHGDENATPFLSLHKNSALSGLAIYYPNQNDTVPIPYPWTVRQLDDSLTIVNLLIINPWNAVDCGTVTGGRHYIRGLYAQPLHTGLYIDNCFDVGRVEDVHFWPFWHGHLKDFTVSTATAFKIGRTDWEYMANCFDIDYMIGYHFFEGVQGPANALLVNSGSDEPGISVLIEATEAHAGVSFVNGQFMGGIIINDTNQGPIKFTSCGFWGMSLPLDHHAIVRGGYASFSDCHFIYWGNTDPTAACIYAEGESVVSVTGCNFMDQKPQLFAGDQVRSAVFTGNSCSGGTWIKQQCLDCVTAGLNGGY